MFSARDLFPFTGAVIKPRELFHHSAREILAQKPMIPICPWISYSLPFVSRVSTLIKEKQSSPTTAQNIPINVMNMHDRDDGNNRQSSYKWILQWRRRVKCLYTICRALGMEENELLRREADS